MTKLDELRELYIQHLRFKNYTVSHLRSARRQLKRFYEYLTLSGVKDNESVTPETIEGFKRYLMGYRYVHRTGESRNYCMGYIVDQLNTVKKFFNYLMTESIVMSNPVDDVVIPDKGNPIPRGIMSEKEVKRILAQPDLKTPVGYRDRTMMEVFYATGIRNSELCRLKIKDVDLEKNMLKVIEGKGLKDRAVPLSQACARFLRRYIQEFRPCLVKRDCLSVKHRATDGTVFVGKSGSKLFVSAVCDIIKRYAKAAELTEHITPHCFRHTVATHLLKNGMDIRYVQEFLGHEHLRTTQRYTRVNVSELRRKMAESTPVPLRRKAPQFKQEGWGVKGDG